MLSKKKQNPAANLRWVNISSAVLFLPQIGLLVLCLFNRMLDETKSLIIDDTSWW